VFDLEGLREAPLERGGDRPVRRANRAAVAALAAVGTTG
jgi:hypothetical protein